MDLRRSLVKGKFLLSVFAFLLPMSLAAQVVAKPAADTAPAFNRYEVFAGVDYMAANQVKSSSALIGGNGGVSAKLVKWFGGTVDFGDYSASATSHGLVKPSVTTLMAGPEFYIPADSLTGFFHVLMGGAHTSNVGSKPDVAFSYAIGGGFEYAVSKHWAARLSGDGVIWSSVLDPDNQNFSPHRHVDARASAGVAYRF
jgi:opacity protein-like surface antigen